MVFLVARRLDRVEILDEARFPLRCLTREKAVKIVEAKPLAGGPVRERPHRRGFGGRRVVPLTERRRFEAVVTQHLSEGRRSARDHARITVPVERALGDRTVANPVMVAPCQQRRAGRRANRRRVECVVTNARVGDARERRRVDRSPVGVGQAEADVVEQDNQNVGRVFGQVALFHPAPMLQRLQRRTGHAGRRRRRERKDGTIRHFSRSRGLSFYSHTVRFLQITDESSTKFMQYLSVKSTLREWQDIGNKQGGVRVLIM